MNQNYKNLIYNAVIISIIAIVLVMAYFVVNSVNDTEQNRENYIRSSAQLVSSAVNSAFIKPITVAKAMAEDVSLQDYLKKSGKNAKSVEAEMQEYLTSMRDGFGYKMVFAVSHNSGAYYTCDGITAYLQKNYQGASKWYGSLLDSGKEWDLDVDVEESAGWELSVFINQIVKDNDKNILGVCGTAVEMTKLQQLFELYERIYNVKIDVTDVMGLIQIDTDMEKIEKEYISLPDFDIISDGEYYYEKNNGRDRVITFMKDIDMFLIVTNNESLAYDVMSDIKVPLIIALLGILIAVGLVIYAEYKYNKKETK